MSAGLRRKYAKVRLERFEEYKWWQVETPGGSVSLRHEDKEEARECADLVNHAYRMGIQQGKALNKALKPRRRG